MSKYAPDVTENPVRLALKLLFNRKPAARSALLMAGAGVALSPFDRLLESREQELYQNAPAPPHPVVIVCGPPRSGTTLVAQYLINALDVGYINNLTSLFPRSPLVANQLLRRWVQPASGDYNAFYGKSRGLSGANDGLYIWDRWLGEQRDAPIEALSADADPGIPQFFGALQQQTGKPVVNKVNRMISGASLVADVFPQARFIGLRRDPVMLAQSLLEARDLLTGSRQRRYGLSDNSPPADDAIEDVCRQVEYLNTLLDQQLAALGPERFLLLDYEQFCRQPAQLLSHLIDQWQLSVQRRTGSELPESFQISNQQRLPPGDMRRLQARLAAPTR